jgi:5-methylcytosine-specific restriction endonuclease McrA
MQRHTKIYYKYFDYGEQDVILCECCHKPAVDIHHIHGRYGSQANTIKNLMALCRKCHDKAHGEKLSKSDLQYIHNNVLANNSKQFVK